jgi:HD-GYP domain-containing protein (c-di-GMP phosphodiesterase class II)
VLASEPDPVLAVSEGRLDAILGGFAEIADLKSRFLHGHSTGVAELAAGAAAVAGLEPDALLRLRRAGWVHDIGRVLVPTGVWDRPGPLTTADWELVRLHPYHTERILSASPRLRELARLAGMHHERLNGLGYHRGASPGEQDVETRLLAAADAFHALTEERPHRQAHSPEQAARLLEAEALDRQATGAVLAASGQRAARRREWPAGLTDREVEVLRPLVRGRSLAEIARELGISTSTVHTHVAHIYEKAGVRTRAGAAIFAMESDLLSR